MANLTIAAADVAPVRVIEQHTGPAGEAIDAGEMVRLDTSTGMFTLSNATTAAEGRAFGMAIDSASLANITITVVKKGLVDVGDALDAESYDEEISLSDTDGKLDDGAGTPTTAVPIGRVMPSWGATTADKILLIEL